MALVAASTGSGDVAAGEAMTPLERLASTPKGQLKSPYEAYFGLSRDDQTARLNASCAA
jgi:hypothetical protein